MTKPFERASAKLFVMPPRGVPDLEARAQALDVTRSWIVEAPAGSGKTGLLIQRYLRLLADASITEPEQVLAITFTRNATEEIRDRVLRELHRAADGIPPENDFDAATRAVAGAALARDTECAWRLLDEPRRIRVRTIDAVCAEIARSLPILSGGGALRPIDEPSTLYREAARRTWLRLGGDDPVLSSALRTLLLHRDGDLDSCEQLVANMLADREQWGSLVPLRDSDLEDAALESSLRAKLDLTLGRAVCDGLGKLARAFPAGVLNALAQLAAEFGSAPAYAPAFHPLALCRDLHDAPGESAQHLAHWRALTDLVVTKGLEFRSSLRKNHLGVDLTTAQQDALKLLVAGIRESDTLLQAIKDFRTLPPPEFPEEQWHVTMALVRVLRNALVDLQLVFAERGECDFAEPALLARHALDAGGAGGVEAAIGTQLKHLLVDEMQDTSIRQYQLIERLTAGWAHEGKTVFLVGDPKQSIYLFRQARVERFVATMASGLLGTLPVGLLRLSSNFRSQAGLVDAFNEDFSAIFPPLRDPGEIEYVRASATRPETPALAGDAGAAWHLRVAEGSVADAKIAARAQTVRDAREVRRIVDHWRAKPLPAGRSAPWKIAVLVRSRASLTRLLPELRRSPSVPIRALKIDTLGDRREILDLLALTRALLHPADRTAWLAVLHAPWCGLGLNDLHLLTGQDASSFLSKTVMELIDLHGADLGPEGVIRLERVWPVLDAAVRSAARLRLPERVERTWRSLGGDAYLDPIARENVDTFLRLLRTIDSDSRRVTRNDLEQRLARLYAAPGHLEGAVDLVTIHGAKGLEWDAVLVPDLNRMAPRDRPRLLDWEELPDGGVVLAPIAGKGEESHALNRWLRSLRSARDAAERQRLFYVASTRAREELHLFGTVRRRTGGEIKPEAGSLLEAAWPAAQHRLEEVGHTAQPPAAATPMLFEIAAGADPFADESSVGTPGDEPALLERLPLSFRPFPARPAPTPGRDPVPHVAAPLLRPQGSFAARCLGTAVHAFLEEAANRLAHGVSAATLARELPSWQPRIRAVLRADGLSPTIVEAQTRTVLTALSHTLDHPDGRWLLEARTEARNELALTVGQGDRRQYRIDRIFRAGSEPGQPGQQHLWIIDYKTSGDALTSRSDTDPQENLRRERARYAPQLERYAAAIGEPGTRLGLWFPLRRLLLWWVAGESPTDSLTATADRPLTADRSSVDR